MKHLPPSVAALLLLLVAMPGGCREEASPAGGRQADGSAAGVPTQRVRIAGRAFDLELALDAPSRYRGLSDRPSIPADGGMLFVFPDVRELDFVMRQCLVPIDILFLGPGGHVVAMHRMKVEPYDTPERHLRRYGSGWAAQFAIELAGGTLDQLQVKVGQKIDLPLEDLKRRAR